WRRGVSHECPLRLLGGGGGGWVCRAGARPVAGPAAPGVPSVLMPLAGAPRDHQTKNARVLERAGAAVLVPDPKSHPARLESVLDELLGDPARLDAMADAARGPRPRAGHPRAAARRDALASLAADGHGC